ncbi:hypothetical protein [Streptomyces lomondensis]|uniref:Secreted protein n=1 Tax=Streptomyces lomondensis TaxID=68229 RepID=A0ABQ2WWD6_9ACTN|nr:hypothetical protein [Streptomyces lomondensis]MCF0078700.1 hypothetical protein [Streptomyces lomondensis]GGW79400.1 hypothetical protein GCM10010383_03690 [Streptomyces lomondensis]
MRKFQKAAVVVAMLGSVGVLGAPTAFAGEKDASFDVSGGRCSVEGDSIAVLSNISALNGVLQGIVQLGDNENSNGNPSLQQGHKVDCSTRGFTG